MAYVYEEAAGHKNKKKSLGVYFTIIIIIIIIILRLHYTISEKRH